MIEPFFSVIIATFNSEKTLEECLNSLLAQTLADFEIVIIDGESTDKTVRIIELYLNKFQEQGIKYQWLSEKDQGIYDAWNKGLDIAKGKWVSFLGADDTFVKEALERYKAKAMESEFQFISAKANLVQSNLILDTLGIAWDWPLFRREMKVVHVGSIHLRSYFERYGIFDTTYKIAGDYEMLLRARKNLKAGFINQVLVHMGTNGISNRMVDLSLNEAKRAKVETANRSRWISQLEKKLVKFKILLKPIFKK